MICFKNHDCYLKRIWTAPNTTFSSKFMQYFLSILLFLFSSFQ